MEAFKEAWLAIDKSGRGVISATELTAYMKEQKYDEAFVNKWLRLFDSDNSGTIEIEEYCDVLGLNPKMILSEIRSRIGAAALPDGIEFVSGDMEHSWQIKIAHLCLAAMRGEKHMRDIPKLVKTQCDTNFGSLWHCVIVNGQFWCYYGHEPGFSFVFRYGKYIFIIFKTPTV